MNKKNRSKYLHVLLFLCYCLMLVYALFFMFMPLFDGDANLRGNLNLTPLGGFIEVYTRDSGFVGSHAMWNVFLFIPMGVFLPLLFGKFMNRMWKVIPFSLFISALCEFIQYFVGRSADIDDVIANTLGALIGYIAWFLCGVLLPKVRHNVSDKPLLKLASSAILSVPVAFVIFTPFLVLDHINAASEFGVFRDVLVRLPYRAEVADMLSNETCSLPYYEYLCSDLTARCKEMMEALGINGEAQGGSNIMSVDSTDQSVSLSVYDHGRWTYRDRNGANANSEDPLAAPLGIIEILLEGHGSIEQIEQHATPMYDGNEVRCSYTLTVANLNPILFYSNNEITVVLFANGGFEIHSYLAPTQPIGEIAAISPRHAYLDSTFWGVRGYDGIDAITLKDILYLEDDEHRLLPYYRFSYTIDGVEHFSFADAIKR